MRILLATLSAIGEVISPGLGTMVFSLTRCGDAIVRRLIVEALPAMRRAWIEVDRTTI